jgi:hypothetical protein
MKTITPYKWEINNNKYHFVTDNFCVYDIVFEYSEKFFDEYCTSCKDIFEMTINCLSHDCPVYDSRAGLTVCKIVEEVLSESCNGIMYRIYDGDGKQERREMRFDRWIELYDSEDKIDQLSQEFCEEECDKYFLLVDKGCKNYPVVVHDFNYRCKECEESGDIIQYGE